LADNALAPAESYAALYRDFRWTIPARFNIAEACVDRWAAGAPDRTALIRTDGAGGMETIAYGTLKADSDRLALALGRRGLKRGDRIAILLPQSVETVLAISPPTSSAPSRCRLPPCSGRKRSPTG
jgi:acetyl-CoA synthetase